MKYAIASAILLAVIVTQPLMAQEQEIVRPRPKLWVPSDYSWTKRTWSQTNDPYVTAAQEIETYLKQNRQDRKYVDQLSKGVSEKSPSLQRYRFAYASAFYYLLNPATDYNEQWVSLSKALRILSAPPTPASKQYDLVRFITQMGYSKKIELLPIAERLHQADPQNLLVANYYTYLLRGTFSVPNIRKALKINKNILADHPELPNAYIGVGLVYWDLWGSTRQVDYADQAISHLESYLNLAPSGDSFRPEATRIISLIRASKARWLSQHPSGTT